MKDSKAVVKILGIPDVFGDVAAADLLWDSYQMDAQSVCSIAMEMLG